MDLSSGNAIEFEFLCRQPAPVGYFAVYFQTESGWYNGSFFPELTTGWNTIRIKKTDFIREGEPAGWDKIIGIRLSGWRGADEDTEFYVSRLRLAGMLGVDASVALLRSDSIAGNSVEDKRVVERFTDSLNRHFSAAGVNAVVISDKAATLGELAKARLVVLPYNPSLPAPATSALLQYLAAGGKVLAFRSVPEPVLNALHVKASTQRSPSASGQDWSMDLSKSALTGAPESVRQPSSAGGLFEAIPGESKVLAEWRTTAGPAQSHPAVISSTNGIVVSHGLLGEDGENKTRLLLAMAGALAPEVWRESAQAAYDRVGRISTFSSYDEARSRISSLAGANAEVAAILTKAHGFRQEAGELLAKGSFPAARAKAVAASEDLEQAFFQAQRSLPGEFRAFWCHSAFGVRGMSWDEAIGRLARSGFTAILPNMLWGGVTFYPSDLLPQSAEALQKGDQIAQCLAACRKYGIQIHVWKVNWNLGHAAPQEFIRKMRAEHRLQADRYGKEEPWLCPSHPENQKLEIASMVEVARKYDVDGIHFDYIRYPDPDHCFCAGCKERFARDNNVTVQDWPKEVLDSGPLHRQWLDWRRKNITTVVTAVSEQARAVRPKIKISAAVFPNWNTDCDRIGQDWRLWCEEGYLDFVCPMDYTTSNNNFANLVRKQVAWAGKVPCYPGIGVSASSAHFGADKVIDQINLARDNRTGGFVIFNYAVPESTELLPKLGAGTTRQ
jgi:uncharacterized lipoprotein YddW (UPF0748 family)